MPAPTTGPGTDTAETSEMLTPRFDCPPRPFGLIVYWAVNDITLDPFVGTTVVSWKPVDGPPPEFGWLLRSGSPQCRVLRHSRPTLPCILRQAETSIQQAYDAGIDDAVMDIGAIAHIAQDALTHQLLKLV